MKTRSKSIFNLFTLLALLASLLGSAATAAPAEASASQIDLSGPTGSGQFGRTVTVLPNGNFVVTDPFYDAGAVIDVGAVYLYEGATRALISTLTGSTTGDLVGYGGVTVLANGNYVVASPDWNNGATTYVGAVTWGDGSSGIAGTVSAANSLTGSTTGDLVGYGGVTVLANGNYVVASPYWDNGGVVNASAVTWGDGNSGITGTVSAANSLVGSTASDEVGHGGVTALSNGNYVVASPYWDNGAIVNAGAATWGNGATGATVGAVSAANSLVGSTAGDRVGDDHVDTYGSNVTALSNGNYVVSSIYWHNGGAATAGAATWGDGSSGITGTVSAANSLVGSTANDYVGFLVVALSNGNYVVASSSWDNGATVDVGAATWGDGSSGIVGAVSAANSLVGSTANDHVGSFVTALSNGNYVVASYRWDNGATVDVGAATRGDGSGGVSGAVSAANSLVGSTANDRVSNQPVIALRNGNYVVPSRFWNNGATAGVGAATWGDGSTGITGAVSAANSLVGSTASDQVGFFVTALNDGNYVVASPLWNNGATAGVGAATWGDGSTGIVGAVSAANSLVGSTAGDRVGTAFALNDGNYVVASPNWDNGGVVNASAVTWGNGGSGTAGTVSTANSLVGSTLDDKLGSAGITALTSSHFAVVSSLWDDGGTADSGAVTLANGAATVGPVSADNSVLGTAASGGSTLNVAFDHTNAQLLVGRPADNKVSLVLVDLVVTTNLDENDGSCADGDCSLRDAIQLNPAGRTITFDSSLSGATIQLGSVLTVAQDMTIDGSALESSIIISGDSDGDNVGDVQVFNVTSAAADVTFESLTITKGMAATGGGIHNAGGLTILNSTISDNTANDGAGSLGYGAGILGDPASILVIANSTFSGNVAEQYGGAIHSNAALTVTNSTFSGNSNGILNGGPMNITNTIIANSTAGDCETFPPGTITGNHNLIEDTGSSACSFVDGSNNDVIGQAPNLGALADNGGPTQTFALLAGSPAIDAGDNTMCATSPVNNLDQRGETRPKNGICDIGAYESAYYTLTASLTGNGSGTVSGSGISCGSDCDESAFEGTVITLTATTDTGSTFSGWSGAGCSGTGTCVVTMTETKSVTADFSLEQHLLTVTTSGEGSGGVSSAPAGIDCGGDCTESYDYNTQVTLTAAADSGSVFSGWSGACSSESGDCLVTMDAAKSVMAVFTKEEYNIFLPLLNR